MKGDQGRSQFYQHVSKVFKLGFSGWPRVQQREAGGVSRKVRIEEGTVGTEDRKAAAEHKGVFLEH